MPDTTPIPKPDGPAGLQILRGMLRERSLLGALTLMHKYIGDISQIPLPRFKPVVVVGAEANRQVLVSERNKLSWRLEGDPVVRLLRRGVLVVDQQEHDEIRGVIEPYLQRRQVQPHIPAFWRQTNRVINTWQDGESRDMLVEMRKIALLILFDSLYAVDFLLDLNRLWRPILDLIEYISPGLWILFPRMPVRRKYQLARQEVDDYLYDLIRTRRELVKHSPAPASPGDLLSMLVLQTSLSDDLIRDQLLTLLIAGHDTSTALLAWTFYLLGMHPRAMQKVREEVQAVIGSAQQPPEIGQLNQLVYTDMVIKETLRLYPPIHIGNRQLKEDMTIHGCHVPGDCRLMYSIYLSHRDEKYWQRPEEFIPERFDRQQEESRPALSYVPFGGGPRNCIGAAFAQVESKVVIARILQQFDLGLLNAGEIKPHMGATLEPRPGVKMRIQRARSTS
jgi:cytochrome P450